MISNVLALATLLACLTPPAPIPDAMPAAQSLPVISLHAPGALLRVQVATTSPQRERGLMNVAHLARHTGMVFVFPDDGPVAFWMKDTLVPLDMVFVSGDGVVRKVFARVPTVAPSLPDAKIPLEEGAAKYVIELPAGEAGQDGLRAGTHVGNLPRDARVT